MAGKSVYLREEEITLIFTMFKDGMNFPDAELERIGEEIDRKMLAALYSLETKTDRRKP